jgi:hypothetical protein
MLVLSLPEHKPTLSRILKMHWKALMEALSLSAAEVAPSMKFGIISILQEVCKREPLSPQAQVRPTLCLHILDAMNSPMYFQMAKYPTVLPRVSSTR